MTRQPAQEQMLQPGVEDNQKPSIYRDFVGSQIYAECGSLSSALQPFSPSVRFSRRTEPL